MNTKDEIKAKVLEEYDSGVKATALAEKYSISRGTIYLWLNNRRTRPSIDEAQKSEMVRLVLEEGKSASEVAKQFSVSIPSVHNWVRETMERDILFEDTDENSLKDKEIISRMEARIAELNEENAKLVEKVYLLEDEVKLYKGLLSKLNTLIDNQGK